MPFIAFSAAYPVSSGDIADNGPQGWNDAMPGKTETAVFNSAGGSYTAGSDVEFGSVRVSGNSVFNLHTSGNHTVKAANFNIGYYNRSVTLNGGLWDMSGSVSGENLPVGSFAACNQSVTYNTVLTLAESCVVTNVTTLRLAYNSSRNTMKITDSSRVYTKGVTLCNNYGSANGLLEVSSGGVLTVLSRNFTDTAATKTEHLIDADTTNRIVITGAGSKIVCPESLDSTDPRGFVVGNCYGRNSLLVTDGGELVAPYRFALGYSPFANNNSAVFEDGAKFSLSDFRVGEGGSCGNTVRICSGATGVFASGNIGGAQVAGNCNTFVLSNATLKCRMVYVSRLAASQSNAFYVVGSDTSFTTTVTDVPRYPFVYRGRHNTFEMDGSRWNYFLNMQLDHASCSNSIRFVNGAKMCMNGGLFSGTNDVYSCDNSVYVADGAELNAKFCYISRENNVFTVSNATLSANASALESYNGIIIGATLQNVAVEKIGGNGIVLQGNSPKVRSASRIQLLRNSFLRLEVPTEGYEDGNVPIMAPNISIDATSELAAVGLDEMPFERGQGASYVIATASDTLSVPAAVLASANERLAGLERNFARFGIDATGRSLLLHVRRRCGTVLSVR
jgi:hypothetical protein